MNYLNYGLKGGGLALMGIGIFGCIIYPLGYIPSSLYFIAEQKPAVIWSVFIGFVVVGAALAYFGWKAEKAKEDEQKAGQ
jgi:hypothetical protein